jgi:hypothetical protein
MQKSGIHPLLMSAVIALERKAALARRALIGK